MSCKEDALKNAEWKAIKMSGSDHYRAGDVQLIDLIRDIRPHPDLTVLDVFSLVCVMKYGFRQITRGKSASDTGKISHYAEMIKWGCE